MQLTLSVWQVGSNVKCQWSSHNTGRKLGSLTFSICHCCRLKKKKDFWKSTLTFSLHARLFMFSPVRGKIHIWGSRVLEKEGKLAEFHATVTFVRIVHAASMFSIQSTERSPPPPPHCCKHSLVLKKMETPFENNSHAVLTFFELQIIWGADSRAYEFMFEGAAIHKSTAECKKKKHQKKRDFVGSHFIIQQHIFAPLQNVS